MPLGDAGDWKQWSQYVLKQLEETNEQIKNIHEILQLQGETLLVNTNDLKDHMSRTKEVEESNKLLAQKMDALEKERIEKEAILKYKQDTAIFIGKIFGGFAFVVGLIYSIFQVVDYIKEHLK